MLCTISEKTTFRMKAIGDLIVLKEQNLRNRRIGAEAFNLLTPLYVFGITNKYKADVVLGPNLPKVEKIISFLEKKGITAVQSDKFKLNKGNNIGLSTNLRRRSIEDSVRAVMIVALVLNNLIEAL